MNASKDVLTSVLHTAQMGISGIEAVKHKAQKPELRQFLQEQQEEYSRIEAESMRLAQKKGWQLPHRSVMADTMSCMAAKCKVMMGDKDSAIADMLIQGNTRGMINGIKHLHQNKQLDPSVNQIAETLLNLENMNIQKSQKFL